MKINTAAIVLIIFSSLEVQAQDLAAIDVGNTNSSAAVSGANVFDFSNSRSNPAAPGLPSFAGGPCVGEGFAASTSMAGIAVGSGRSSLDHSCQRRNWVQTLIGASQHMSEEEARVMMRIAVEVMRDDPYLAGALERAGIGSANAEAFEIAEKNRQRLEELRQTTAAATNGPTSDVSSSAVALSTRNLSFASSCVVTANELPASARAMLQARDCRIFVSGEQD